MGRGDKRGQSELIGGILVFGIVVAMLSFNQAFLVPIANEDIEAQHDRTVRSDMIELRSGIVEAAGSNAHQSVTIQLGTDFPPRLLAINPPPVSGTLRTDPPEANGGNITVDDADFSVRSLCGVGETGDNVSTTFVTYDAEYNGLSNRPTTVVENTVVHRNRGALLDTNQVIVKGNHVRIIRVVGEYQSSGTKARSIDLYPSQTNVTNTSDEFNITLPSQIGADEWNGSLLEGEDSVDDVAGTAGSVTIDMDEPATEYIVTCTTVGVDEQPDVTVDPPPEVELRSSTLINPVGSDVLEMTNVESQGSEPNFDLTFTNNIDENLTLNRTRVVYIDGPGGSTGDSIDFYTDYDNNKTELVVGGGLINQNGTVQWDANGGEGSVQLHVGNNPNSGVAIELELEEPDGDVHKFAYFIADQ